MEGEQGLVMRRPALLIGCLLVSVALADAETGVAGQCLISTGVVPRSWGPCVLAGPPPTIAVAADQISTVTTFANVTGLTLTVLTGKTYVFECRMTYTAALTTTVLHVSISGPTASAIDYAVTTHTSATAVHVASQTAYDTSTAPPASGAAVRLPVIISGAVATTSAGALNLRFHSSLAASAVTIKRGSWCQFWAP
jgi:hypothetical protein